MKMKIIEIKKGRFRRENISLGFQILVDTETGVQYLTSNNKWATVLLNVDGKPLIDNSYRTEEKQ